MWLYNRDHNDSVSFFLFTRRVIVNTCVYIILYFLSATLLTFDHYYYYYAVGFIIKYIIRVCNTRRAASPDFPGGVLYNNRRYHRHLDYILCAISLSLVLYSNVMGEKEWRKKIKDHPMDEWRACVIDHISYFYIAAVFGFVTFRFSLYYIIFSFTRRSYINLLSSFFFLYSFSFVLFIYYYYYSFSCFVFLFD